MALDKFRWCDISRARVKALYADGASSRSIADTISYEFRAQVGRNAVIGLIHRHKFESPMSKKNQPVRSNLAPIVRKRSHASAAKDNGPPKGPAIHLPPQEGDALLAFGKPCGLMELRPESCRWPLGGDHDRNYLFCNAEQVEGRPYCLAHARCASRPYSFAPRVPEAAAG